MTAARHLPLASTRDYAAPLFPLRLQPQLDKPAFETETAPAMENWSRQPITVSPGQIWGLGPEAGN
jgi:hypothetical protein